MLVFPSGLLSSGFPENTNSLLASPWLHCVWTNDWIYIDTEIRFEIKTRVEYIPMVNAYFVIYFYMLFI